MTVAHLLHPVLALMLAPLLPGVIHRVKAIFGGRRGSPVLQAYYDIGKLLRKGSVVSGTTTWLFSAGPIIGLAALLTALAFVPLGGLAAPLAFPGDLILVAYLLGLARFFTVLAALDTGSSFEGMGGSREVLISSLAEPAFLLALAAVSRLTGHLSLSSMIGGISGETWLRQAPPLALVVAACAVVYLAENARIPVDDPNTHLELTMIHEVMVLDHSGPGLAFIQYASALKLWVLGAIIAGIAVPIRTGNPWIDGAAGLGGLVLFTVLVGIVESTRARLRLRAIPQLLVGAGALAALAVILVIG
jgi:formate hydrogenlyase subunit 4